MSMLPFDSKQHNDLAARFSVDVGLKKIETYSVIHNCQCLTKDRTVATQSVSTDLTQENAEWQQSSTPSITLCVSTAKLNHGECLTKPCRGRA